MDKENRTNTIKKKLAKVYKINVIDAENLSLAATYRSTLGRLVTWLLILVLVSSVFTVACVSLTPLKRLIPGYGNIEENQKYLELKSKIHDLEAGVEAQQTYINGLQKMFDGELDRTVLPEIDKRLPISNDGEQVVSKISIAEAKNAIGLNKAYFTSPVQGSISAGFDIETEHFGVDVLAVRGTPIKAIAPGMVTSADWSLDSGNSICIQHANNTISFYKHNSSLLKNTGDYVKAGEAIAIIGNTGTLSDGPHLHFELWYNGSPINPENYITF